MTEPLSKGSKLVLPDGKEYVVYSHTAEVHRCGKTVYTAVLRREDAELTITSTGRTALDILTPESKP